MTKKVEARTTQRMRASPERVYGAWLDPQKVRIWMRSALLQMGLPGDVRRVEIDPRVGGRFAFSDIRPGGEALHWGTYLEMDPPRKLVFTWFTSVEDEEEGTSIVSLTLEPEGDGCIATIVHQMDAKWAEYAGRTEQGWSRMLEHVGRLTEEAQS